MRTLILSAALLALAGCNPSATTNVAASNASEANDVEPDITEVPDESADANGAAADVDDGNEAEGNGSNGADDESNATR